jgi:hypothetical protein
MWETIVNGFKSKSFSKEILNQPLRGVFLFALAATLALPLTSLAQPSPYTISDYPDQDAGDWSQGATVTGPPDGSCRGLGAVNNVNEVFDFNFALALPEDANITGIEAYVRAVSAKQEDVGIRLTLDHTTLPGSLIGADDTILDVPPAGKGNCASATDVTVGPGLDVWGLDTYPGGGTKLADDIVDAGAVFGIVFTTLFNSSVKLDSVCLEITYTSETDPGPVTSCFDIPTPEASLTLFKDVTNNFGGNAVPSDFTLILNGGAYTDTVFDHEGEPVVVVGQTYTLSEAALDGYTQTGEVVCVDAAAGDAPVTHPVTMVDGQDVECTISNVDIAPTLTLMKSVVGGGTAVPTDFTLHLNGGIYTGNEDFLSGATPTVVSNQQYTLSEDSVANYGQTGIACVDTGNGNAPVTHPVTLNEGQTVTCTITNTFNPPPPPPPPPSIAVPTLSQWALILLAMLMLGVGFYAQRERRIGR